MARMLARARRARSCEKLRREIVLKGGVVYNIDLGRSEGIMGNGFAKSMIYRIDRQGTCDSFWCLINTALPHGHFS